MILVKLFQSSVSFLVPSYQLCQVEAIPQLVYNTGEPYPILELLGKNCVSRAAGTNHLVKDLL